MEEQDYTLAFAWPFIEVKITTFFWRPPTFVTAAHFIMMSIHRNPINTRSDPLGFRDLYETLLNKLCSPRHRISVDLYSGNDVCISPAMDLCCSATEFGLHTSLHQVCNKLLIRVAGSNISVVVIRLVM